MLRVVLWIAIPLVSLAGFGYWNAHRVADATLARHRAKSEQERKELSARVRTRAALLAPIAEGTAEEVADRVAKAVVLVPEEERNRLPIFTLDEAETAPPEEQDRVLAAHPEPLSILAGILHVPSTCRSMQLDPRADEIPGLVAPRRMAARWVSLHLRRALARSDGRELPNILRRVGELVTLGADFERRGTLVAELVGAALEGLALAELPAALAMGPVPVEDARSLARTLDLLEAARLPLSEVADVERANLRGLLSVEKMDVDVGVRKVGWRHLWSGKLYRAEALDELDAGMDHLQEILKAMPTDPRGALRDAGRLGDGGSNLLGRMGLAPWRFALLRVIRRDALWRVARTALAVAIHTAELGAPPASLAALVPTYLPSVPIDPWDGTPLRYAAGPPARVWSVGLDGKDDGGTPIADPDDDTQPGDFVITVSGAR